METNTPDPDFTLHDTPQVEIGRIPHLMTQKSLISLTGETLRPGGLMLTGKAVEICDFSPEDRILDAGCGYGMTLRYLQKTHKINALGTDSDLEILKKTNHRTHMEQNNIPFVQSSLPNLPFKTGSFKGIFCECVFSLVPDKKACLKEFLRLLELNGKLVLTDLYIPQRFAAQVSSEKTIMGHSTCLDSALPIIELIDTVEKAGFKIDIIEDHTRLLKQLAGQLLFQHNSAGNPWKKLEKDLCGDSLSAAFRSGRLRPGYCMIIAGKYK